MKVDKIDFIWAMISFISVGISFWYGYLLYDILGIYGLFAALMMYHVFRVKKQISNTAAVYGTITDYHTVKGVPTHYYPVVRYETEEGREINSVYTFAEKSPRYEIGDEELICYDPDDPVFFYFANRENELTANYYRYIIYGAFPAFIVFIMLLAK